LKAVLAKLSGSDDISCRHFFSGAAAFVDGHIFMSLSPAGLALKLPKEDCRTLFEQGGKPLRYFPKAPVKKDYVILPPRLVNDESALADWILSSIKSVRNFQAD
jgi:TfoX/Sxy family transcriptional regulator of competence genes